MSFSRSKKASLLDWFIVLVVIGAMVFAVVHAASLRLEKTIGDQQFTILSSYAEAEKVLEYLKQAAELSVFKATTDCEFVNSKEFETSMKNYIKSYATPNQKLKVILPNYKYSEIVKKENAFEIDGIPDSEILISSDLYDFEYKHSGHFKTTADCETYKIYKGEVLTE